MAIKFLNSKEKKSALDNLEKEFGIKTDGNFHLIRDIDNLYLFTGELEGIDINKLRISQIGARIGVFLDNKIILTIQGAQILAGNADKNIIDLNDFEKRDYLKGKDIACHETDGIYLIKSGDDFLGCSKVRNQLIRNNLENSRRIDCKD